MEDDLFYDLFGEDGFLTPKSTGSTDHDSGHGSPFESPFDDASPLPAFAWDTAEHTGELWGSILDDLPSDLTDDSDSNSEQKPLHLGNIKLSTGDYNDPLSWSTKIMEESTHFDCSSNTMNFDDDWNLHGNVFDDMRQDHLPVNMSYVAVDNTPPITPVTIPVKSESPLQPDDITVQNEIKLKSTQPIAIKPVKSPTWVVKTSDLKSHLQLGQNIIAIIQNVNNDGNVDMDNEKIDDDDDDDDDDVGAACCTFSDKVETSDIEIPHNERSPIMHHSDHDYADKDLSHITQTTGVSQGMGPGLLLTDEEKKLLELEGLKLPEDVPLTKEEEKVLKKVRRKIKNKQSAMESRRKRKEYIDNLERRVKHCTDLNNGLRKKVDKLSKENKVLVNQLKVMKEFIGGSLQETRTASTGTCLAILLLSFALFVVPFNPFYYFEGKSETIATDSASPTPMFRSRTLLAVDDNTDYFYQDELTNSSYHMLHNYYSHDPQIENVKAHFEEGDSTNKESNISMYMHQNFTWYSTLNKKIVDRYILTF